MSAWGIRISRQSANKITPEHELSYILKIQYNDNDGGSTFSMIHRSASFVLLSVVPWYVVTFLGTVE